MGSAETKRYKVVDLDDGSDKNYLKYRVMAYDQNFVPAYYISMCPNCGGDITSDRLSLGFPCDKCVPEIPKGATFEDILRILENTGKLKNFKRIYDIEKESERFAEFFKKIVGFPPWSLQLAWAKRVLSSQSFMALAPTGVGKTTFGMVMSLFISGKSYIIMPTKLLSKLLVKRLIESADKMGVNKKILFVDSSKPSSKDRVVEDDYDILITTSMFLARNQELVSRKKFDFIFIDDVDSYLKQPKNVERVLKLMGLSDEDMQELKNLMNQKFFLARDREKTLADKIKDFQKISEKVSEIRKKVNGVLVVSSATAKARASTIRYFREIFGFEISPYTTTLRNIEDTVLYSDYDIKQGEEIEKVKINVFEKVAYAIRKCGKGCFVFVSSEYGKQSVSELKNFLLSQGINSITYEEFNEKNQERFRAGEIDVVIGISSLRNPLCRGIDMPDAVRYAVFAGIPRFVFSMGEIDEPAKLIGVLFSLRNILGNGKKIYSFIETMKKYAGMRAEDIEKYPAIKNKIDSIKEFINERLKDPEFIQKIRDSEDVPIRVESDGRFRIVVADSSAYIQASGRTSRLYIGGLSKGLSVLIVDDRKSFFQLKKRLKLDLLENLNFKDFSSVDISAVLQEIDKDRENIKNIIKGDLTTISRISSVKPPKSAVFIVESPNKAGTIARLIGKPTKRKIRVYNDGETVDVWEVSRGDMNITILASGGHIFDLPFSYSRRGDEKGEKYGVIYESKNGEGFLFVPKYMAIKRCRSCGENFFEENACPWCGSTEFEDKTKIIRAIEQVCSEADYIFIATDPDHEGEKIAFDIFLSVPKFKKDIKRAEYHEVTRRAIFKAIDSPRDINLSLVKAQIVRRITDRWVGFVMSEYLQKKEDKIWLSAGRVQTTVLGWLVEREKQMKEKIGNLEFKGGDYGIHDSIKIQDKSLAKEVSISIRKLKGRKRKDPQQDDERLKNAKIKVSLELKETFSAELKPQPPLNTADMLKEAFSKFRFSATQTMTLAQNLFEAGLITYHRTDSHHVSDVGISIARDFISENYGEKLFAPRVWEEEGAHECIRPTKNLTPDELSISVKIGSISLPKEAVNLYEIIFTRFMASQMTPVKVLKGIIEEKVSWNGIDENKLKKQIEVVLKVLEDGWNKILFLPIPRFAEHILEKRKIDFETPDFKFSFVPPVPPYTQASLVDEMKKKGIGRPSTWAYIIKTLLDRGYCIERSGYIIITKLGKEIYNILSSHPKYKIYTTEDYTRELEEKMDKVERREEDYMKILENLFKELFL